MASASRFRLLPLVALGLAAALPLPSVLGACVSSTKNPYPPDAGPDAPDGSGGSGGDGGDAGSGPGIDPTLGGPCKVDGDCDDLIDCTLDACDLTIDKCRFLPDDSVCSDGLYCNGPERCAQKLGCTFGEPVGCGDQNPCTIDSCIEATQLCEHVKRDADQDGDPDAHCGGKDCDDTNPAVSSKLPEVCANQKDDDCDMKVDEGTCTSPKNDTCEDPLEITAPGSYAMDSTAAVADYPSLCSTGLPGSTDVVAALLLPAGPPLDVEVTARMMYQDVAVTLTEQCDDPSSEITCGNSFPAPVNVGGKLAKLIGRGLGDAAAPTAYPIYVSTLPAGPIVLDVAFRPAEPKPANETCGNAEPAPLEVPFPVTVIDAVTDLATACGPATGELVYSFDLAAPANLDIFATSTDGDGLPILSLRDAGCALPEDEITCHQAINAHLLAKSLAAGTYYLAVAASAPTSMLVTIELSPPTPPAADDLCDGAPPIPHNKTLSVPLADHQDNIQLGCLPGAVDAAYTLTLNEPSDVLLALRTSQGDQGAVELVKPLCTDPADLLACGAGSPSPVRTAKHNVPAGEYRVVAESIQGSPTELTAFVRKAIPPTLVPFADSCADVLEIPSSGGFFQGTTANATADYNAGCDQAGQPDGGAPEQLLKIKLSEKKRLIFDMLGSSYATMLDIRQGPDCPGTEVLLGCTTGYYAQRSYLDLTLEAATYFIQVDGYAGQSGPWFLDVRVVDP